MIAKEIKLMSDDEGNLIVSLTIPHEMYHNQQIARRLASELKGKLIDVKMKEAKSQRSIDQNDCLWGILTKISDHMNGSHREEDLMSVYKMLLLRANIKREYFRGIRESVSVFENVEGVRAVIIEPNSEREMGGKITIGFWLYYGSSKFNTKEMSSLIELALDVCDELGIDDSEIYKLRNGDKL